VPVPASGVNVNLGKGTASYKVTDLATLDFGDIVNDLLHGASVPAVVSFDVEWTGTSKHFKVRDRAAGYAGDFIQATATIEFSMHEDGFDFVSDPAGTTVSDFAMIGHERNGRFFP